MECHIFFAWGKQIAHIHVASCQCTVHKYKVTNYPAAEGKEAGRPILGGMELISRAGTGKYSEREGGEGINPCAIRGTRGMKSGREVVGDSSATWDGPQRHYNSFLWVVIRPVSEQVLK